MKSENLAYWLQGWLELTPPGVGLTPGQVEIVRRHVALAFAHDIDPKLGDPVHVAALREIHEPSKAPGPDPAEIAKLQRALVDVGYKTSTPDCRPATPGSSCPAHPRLLC